MDNVLTQKTPQKTMVQRKQRSLTTHGLRLLKWGALVSVCALALKSDHLHKNKE